MEQDDARPTLDDTLAVLADWQRRRVLRHLLDGAGGTTTTDELVALISDQGSGDPEQVRHRLHHVHLPKLAARGLVTYDPDSGTVTYSPDPTVERILASLDGGVAGD